MVTSPSKRVRHAAPAKAAKKTPARRPPARTPSTKPPAAPADVTPARPGGATVAKPVKLKLVRDSFTIPRDEYGVVDQLKLRLAKLGRITKKSELLRAGLKLLAALPDDGLTQALAAVPSIKTGRPKNKHSAADSATKPAARKSTR